MRFFLEVPLERIEDVTLVDSVQISSGLITEFLERNIPLSWLSGRGHFFGSLLSNGSIDIIKHQKQFELLQEEKLYFELAKRLFMLRYIIS